MMRTWELMTSKTTYTKFVRQTTYMEIVQDKQAYERNTISVQAIICRWGKRHRSLQDQKPTHVTTTNPKGTHSAEQSQDQSENRANNYEPHNCHHEPETRESKAQDRILKLQEGKTPKMTNSSYTRTLVYPSSTVYKQENDHFLARKKAVDRNQCFILILQSTTQWKRRSM
ncbi:hypothetical protein YC2023_017178 [Brassica napus]